MGCCRTLAMVTLSSVNFLAGLMGFVFKAGLELLNSLVCRVFRGN